MAEGKIPNVFRNSLFILSLNKSSNKTNIVMILIVVITLKQDRKWNWFKNMHL